VGADGIDVICVESEDRVQRRSWERFPLGGVVSREVGASRADRQKFVCVECRHRGAVAGRLLRGGLPGICVVGGECGGAERNCGICVIATYGDELIFLGASDGEDSGRGVVGGDGNGGSGPSFARVGRVKNASGEATGDEIKFGFGDNEEIGIAGGKGAFFGESVRTIFGRKRDPVLPVDSMDDEKFSVDGIAQSETDFFGEASDGVEEKGLVDVGVELLPGLAAVGGFVNAGFIAVATGHQIGSGVAEGDDAAKIEIGLAGDGEAGPGGAVIERAKDDAVGAGSPDGDVAGGWDFCGADATKVGVGARGEGLPRLRVACADTESQEKKYEDES